ncbi:hypothetical protein [Streptomyces kaempferi]|uniref:Uncharacterized protein n=1 Tax=Streptomyces kaempferi TaxID=333725 RepID=A0ABW3XNL1_9ACTN
MTRSSHAREIIGPDDVTFSDVWLIGGFLLFGIVAVVFNAWLIKKADDRSWKHGCVLALSATVYLGIALYIFVWALVHAIDNGKKSAKPPPPSSASIPSAVDPHTWSGRGSGRQGGARHCTNDCEDWLRHRSAV